MNVFQGGYCVDCSCQAFPEGCSCNTDGDCPNGEFCVDCNCNKFPKGCDCEANSGTSIRGVTSLTAMGICVTPVVGRKEKCWIPYGYIPCW